MTPAEHKLVMEIQNENSSESIKVTKVCDVLNLDPNTYLGRKMAMTQVRRTFKDVTLTHTSCRSKLKSQQNNMNQSSRPQRGFVKPVTGWVDSGDEPKKVRQSKKGVTRNGMNHCGRHIRGKGSRKSGFNSQGKCSKKKKRSRGGGRSGSCCNSVTEGVTVTTVKVQSAAVESVQNAAVESVKVESRSADVKSVTVGVIDVKSATTGTVKVENTITSVVKAESEAAKVESAALVKVEDVTAKVEVAATIKVEEVMEGDERDGIEYATDVTQSSLVKSNVKSVTVESVDLDSSVENGDYNLKGGGKKKASSRDQEKLASKNKSKSKPPKTTSQQLCGPSPLDYLSEDRQLEIAMKTSLQDTHYQSSDDQSDFDQNSSSSSTIGNVNGDDLLVDMSLTSAQQQLMVSLQQAFKNSKIIEHRYDNAQDNNQCSSIAVITAAKHAAGHLDATSPTHQGIISGKKMYNAVTESSGGYLSMSVSFSLIKNALKASNIEVDDSFGERNLFSSEERRRLLDQLNRSGSRVGIGEIISLLSCVVVSPL